MAFADNILNVRLQLKYDSLENWARENPTLKSGEVAIAYLPPKGNGEAPAATTAAAVLMKVGPGAFNSLPFASALAADVYEWAKKSENEFITWVNEQIEHPVLSVVDPDAATKKFITKVEVSDHQVTITRSDVALADISDKEKIALSADLGAVSGLTTTAKTAVGAINEHDIEIGNLSSLNTTNKGNLVSAINEALQAVEVGGTGSVVTVTKQATPTTGSEATYVVNQGGKAVDVKIEIPKYDTSADYGVLEVKGDSVSGVEVDKTDAQRPIVKIKANTYDAYGAANDVKTGVENGTIKAKTAEHADAAGKVDQALTVKVGGADVVYDGSAAKTADVDSAIDAAIDELGALASKDTIVADDISGTIGKDKITNFATEVAAVKVTNAGTADKVAHSFTVNGVAFDGSEDKSVTIDAASLGLESAMHFVGALSEAPASAKAGDVYLNTATKKEYVYAEGQGWVELGDEGSHALKTVKIEGEGYLTGGGDLSADRKIDIAQAVKTKIDTAYGWGNHAEEGYLKSGDITDKADKKVPAAAGNIATLDATGNLADSGKKVTDFDAAGAAEAVQTAITTGTATARKAEQDADGNVISTTYAKAADLGDLAALDTITSEKVTDFESAAHDAIGTYSLKGVMTAGQGIEWAIDDLYDTKADKSITINGKALTESFALKADDIVYKTVEAGQDEATGETIYEDVTVKEELDNLNRDKLSISTTGADLKLHGDELDISGDGRVEAPTIAKAVQAIAGTTINGKELVNKKFTAGNSFIDSSVQIELTGEDIKMSDSDATTLNAAITARQTEDQVNALIAAVLNSITTINCGSSTEVI